MKRTPRRRSVLKWTDELAVYAAWVMMPYLTDVWKLSITQAANIVNIWTGSSGAMQIMFAFFSDLVAQKFWMVLLYTFFYNIGFGLLFLSTPPVLHESTGTCSGYKPDCIGDAQRILFFASLVTISVGLSGRATSLNSFLEQNSPKGPSDMVLQGLRMLFWGFLSILTAFVPVILDITQTRLKAWSIQFGILALFNIVATLIFLSGIRSYDKGSVEICSPLTMVARVFVASASKICQPLPDDPNQLHEINLGHDDSNALPHTHTLKFLNKAAILSPSKPKDEQEKKRWTLCGVTEVEITKRLILMLPTCTTFVICGIVIAIGNTYFIEQANNMDRRLGRIKIPLPFFLVLYKFVKYLCGILSMYRSIMSSPNFFWKYIIIVIAELCLVIAAVVERRRLSISKHHKAGETIPMSVFTLIPQFFLLAMTEGLFNWHVDYFFYVFTPQYIGDYYVYFYKGVRGLGTISSVLSVYLVGKFSEMANGKNWFQYSLNQSRLDNYYWTLAVLLAVTFLIHCLLAYIYPDPSPPGPRPRTNNPNYY